MDCDGQNLLLFWTSDGYNFYFSFWAFYPTQPPKKKKLKIKKKKKKKKKPEKNPSVDIIILHMCILNDNHMYSSGYVRLLV